jgi:hypothetical protein
MSLRPRFEYVCLRVHPTSVSRFKVMLTVDSNIHLCGTSGSARRARTLFFVAAKKRVVHGSLSFASWLAEQSLVGKRSTFRTPCQRVKEVFRRSVQIISQIGNNNLLGGMDQVSVGRVVLLRSSSRRRSRDDFCCGRLLTVHSHSSSNSTSRETSRVHVTKCNLLTQCRKPKAGRLGQQWPPINQ